MLNIYICRSEDDQVIEQLFKKESIMEGELKDKIDWFAFGRKLWFDGIRSALKEEIVEVTENHFDDLAITMVDSIVDRLLPEPKD